MTIITNPDGTTYDNSQPFKMIDADGINLTTQEITDLAALQASWAAQQAAYVALPSTQAATALATGIVLTSTGTPSLNGAYATNSQSTADLNAIITYILLNNAFPASVSQLPWPDSSGTMHLFSLTNFKNFATAVANFVAVATIYGNSGGAIGQIPSNAITIP